ncbi:MAG: DNA cytosine methyltransferase [Ruminococcus sp.]|nr:DNA cytosine methyltransferase [Ruminococcus sp.]
MTYVCNCIRQGIAHGLSEIIIDNFAGGGGASTGIEMATGYSVFAAINHDPEAIRMHMANHPYTDHYCESVWDVDPLKACKGHPVGLAWFSPDCKHFSKAKGGKPVEKKIRGLAWIALKWAALVRPRVIMLENVEEFQTWGPCITIRDPKTKRVIVDMSGRHDRKKNEPRRRVAEPGEVIPIDKQLFAPDPRRKGETFRKFVRQLEDLGYKVKFRELVAADYGAPTKRKRFFMIARCDGQPIVWPKPTHGPRNSPEVISGKLKPYVPASDIIDWSIPCTSIFNRKKPLAENTMCRIARGLQKFVINNSDPFIVQVNHGGDNFRGQEINEPMPTLTAKHGFGLVTPYITQIGQTGFTVDRNKPVTEPITTVVSKNEHCLIAPTLIQYHTETTENGVRAGEMKEPIATLDTSNRYALVSAFISKFYSTNTGDKMDNPLPTITASGQHNALCTAHIIQMQGQSTGTDIRDPLNTMTGVNHMGEVITFLIKYYGCGTGQDIKEPLDTITSRDRFGLVEIKGIKYQIVDIGLRMLQPHELYAAQGFPEDYIIDRDIDGKKITKTERVKRCGNAVPPPFAKVLVKSNLPELCTGERLPICRRDRLQQETGGQLRFA